MAFSCLGACKARDIQPFIPLLHANDRAVPTAGPADTPDNWLQADPMLVHAPEFHICLRMDLLEAFHEARAVLE